MVLSNSNVHVFEYKYYFIVQACKSTNSIQVTLETVYLLFISDSTFILHEDTVQRDTAGFNSTFRR